MVRKINPAELHLNKANTSNTEASFLDLHLFISNNIISTKIYEKCDNFDFEIVNFSCEMVVFLALHPLELIFLNSSDLLEHLAMLLTSDLLCFICLVFAMPLCDSVYMCLVVTCGERADLMALVCGVQLSVCHSPIGILSQAWYLIVSIPDLFTLTNFNTYNKLLTQKLLKQGNRYQNFAKHFLNFTADDMI